MEKNALDYSTAIEIADGVYWVGFADEQNNLHCNPYLIMDHGEAVLIDGGSRNDFSTVMLKVMCTGTSPDRIQRLIYQHYDPDLCGNLPHLEAIIQNPELKIISHRENNIFIKYYSTKLPKLCIETLGYSYTFSSGRELRFIRTPYSHSPGSFMTYDTQTKVLFSSDIFGSYDNSWSLYSQITGACKACSAPKICPKTHQHCPMRGILDFHQRVMNSVPALHYALDQVKKQEVSLIAPQHGGLLAGAETQKAVLQQLYALQLVGFSYFLNGENSDGPVE